jgi:mandelamide amidase
MCRACGSACHQTIWDGLDPEVEALCRQAIEALARAGASIVLVNLPEIERLNAAVSFVVALHEPRQDIGDYLALGGSGLTYEDVIAAIRLSGCDGHSKKHGGRRGSTTRDRLRFVMNALRPELMAVYSRAFADQRLDVLAFPTTPLPARPVGMTMS